MQFQLHERGIHAVLPGTVGARVTGIGFCVGAASYGHAAAIALRAWPAPGAVGEP
jgi:hypothetical protein